MKIGNPADKAAAQALQSSAPPATAESHKAAVGATPARPDASATIELSTAATSLLSSSGSAEFDADKVARITQAISDGTFKINPEVIADKLISNAQELLTKSAH